MKVYIGIDWSQNKHDLCYLNQAGARLAQMTIAHTMEGFRRIDEIRERLGVSTENCQIGLETSHNLLIDFLWDQGYSEISIK